MAPSSPASPVPRREAGRRERKKVETRTAIIDAARELFRTSGFDAVTVADIAAGADVSLRTVYRYFATKDDVAIAGLVDVLGHFLLLVEARPADEHPMASLRAALDQLDALTTAADEGAARDRLQQTLELIEAVPAVAGREHHLVMAGQDRLTDLFATRLGARRTDLEPRVYAAAAAASYQAAARTWVRLPVRQRTLRRVWALGREALDTFGAGLDPP